MKVIAEKEELGGLMMEKHKMTLSALGSIDAAASLGGKPEFPTLILVSQVAIMASMGAFEPCGSGRMGGSGLCIFISIKWITFMKGLR